MNNNVSFDSQLNRLDIYNNKELKKNNINIDFIDKISVVNSHLVHFVAKGLNHNINLVRPSHYKSISAVNKTSRKPFAQKRTGRARQGTLKAVHMRGGCVAFGFSSNVGSKSRYKSFFKINKKVKNLAYLHLIKNKFDNCKLIIFNSWNFIPKKTSQIFEVMQELKNTSYRFAFIYNNGLDFDKLIAVDNIKNCTKISANTLNVLDILRYHYLIFDIDALNKFMSLRNLNI